MELAVLSASPIVLLPFLKIIVAGLFTSAPLATTTSVPIPTISDFNATSSLDFKSERYNTVFWDSQVEHGIQRVGALVALLQDPTYSLKTAVWTTNEAAVGEVDLSRFLAYCPGSLDVRLPVLYPQTSNCTILAADDYWLGPQDPLTGTDVFLHCKAGSVAEFEGTIPLIGLCCPHRNISAVLGSLVEVNRLSPLPTEQPTVLHRLLMGSKSWLSGNATLPLSSTWVS